MFSYHIIILSILHDMRLPLQNPVPMEKRVLEESRATPDKRLTCWGRYINFMTFLIVFLNRIHLGGSKHGCAG
jgi:hypothetical protein